MTQRQPSNPLLGRFDQDPGAFRPMFYPVEIQVPVAVGQSEEGSVTLSNQPFIWLFLAHQIMGNTADPEASGLWQDGQYDIEFKDEQSNYQSAPIPAAAGYGGPSVGYQLDLPFPIAFSGTKTLTFRITNRVTRILTPVPPEPVFPVKIVIGGVADWGELG